MNVNQPASVNRVVNRINEIQAAIAGPVAPAIAPSVQGVTSPATFQRVFNETVIGYSEQVTADGVPADLAHFGNGRIPAAALVPIGQGDHRLWAPAATSFHQMASHAASQGVSIVVTDSYRDIRRQGDLAEELGLYSNGGLAAHPGTSNHGWGLSLDLDIDQRTSQWLTDNAWRYGFVNDVPGEPWHWTYQANSA